MKFESASLSLLLFLKAALQRVPALAAINRRDGWSGADEICSPFPADDAKFSGRFARAPYYPKDTGVCSQLGTWCSFGPSKPLQG